MVRDTRWQYPRVCPSQAARRAIVEIVAMLDSPPAGTDPEVLLAELEQRRADDDARRAAQGVLPL